jgi:hypothetical protein
VRCRFCHQRAGWLRRACATCIGLYHLVTENRGVGLSEILDLLVSTGASRPHIDAFLAADPEGRGSIRDQVVADATNELMGALGLAARQTPADVKRVRERGSWKGYDKRPPGTG